MRVRLKPTADGAILVTPVDSAGGTLSGNSILVRPGERWRGYKFRRLRRMGDAVVDLSIAIDPTPAIGEDIGAPGGPRRRD